jgi:apolipoprotein N-acyltransferase
MQSFNSNRIRLGLAAGSGMAFTSAFPNIDMGWLAWIAIVPLLVAVRNVQWKRAFGIGFAAGMVHYLSLIYWVAYTMQTYGHLPWLVCISILVLLAAYLALYFGAFTALVCRICPNPVSMLIIGPVIWVALEYIRSFFLSGFPWELLGYSQYRVLHLIQISDTLGPYGISFLILFVNGALLFLALRILKLEWHGARITGRFVAAALTLGIILTGSNWMYGDRRLTYVDQISASSPSIKVGVIQGNIEQVVKWNPAFQEATVEKYLRLSQTVGDTSQTDLIVWPETALPFHFLHDVSLTEKVQEGIRRKGTYFLVGAPSFVRGKERLDYYNSAYLVGPQGNAMGKYNKMHLVPFGEYVPLKKWLPFIGKLVAQVGDFSRGTKGDIISWKEGKLGVFICYEAIFPYITRAMVVNGANLLINITNDAWYGHSSAPYQHFSIALFRAVENRRALVRAANTGISGFVDPAGRIVAPTALFADAAIAHKVPLISMTTFYTRFGDIFAVACLVVTIFFTCIQLINRIKTRGN